MKKNFKILLVAALMISAPFIIQAQTPPHPNSGSAPGSNNTRVGETPNSAPVGSGSVFLVILASLYATKKGYSSHSTQKKEQTT
jgi:hypothetical protein